MAETTKEISAKNSAQLSLWNFLIDPINDAGKVTKAIQLWDGLPIYTTSKRKQSADRNEDGVLKPIEFEFEAILPVGQSIESFNSGTKEPATRIEVGKIEISPAILKVGKNKDIKYFFPSDREQKIEHALRVISLRAENREIKQEGLIVVNFTLNMIRTLLSEHKCFMTIAEIVESLYILKKADLKIKTETFEYNGGVLIELGITTKEKYEENPHQECFATFNRTISNEIINGLNREIMLAPCFQLTGLSKWLWLRMATVFTYAGEGQSFNIMYSTIKKQSMRCTYPDGFKNYAFVEKEIQNLLDANLLKDVKIVKTKKGNKMVDIKYIAYASDEFAQHIKKSNKAYNYSKHMKRPQEIDYK